MNIFNETKKICAQQINELDRFLRNSLLYMNKYSEIMDTILDSRINYLLLKKFNNKGKNDKSQDSLDFNIENILSNPEWDNISCIK